MRGIGFGVIWEDAYIVVIISGHSTFRIREILTAGIKTTSGETSIGRLGADLGLHVGFVYACV